MIRPAILGALAVVGVAGVGGAALAADDGALRPYLQLNLMRSIYTNTDAGPVDLLSPSGEVGGGIAFGTDIGRHWSAEVNVNSVETDINAPSDVPVGEYANWTILGLVRYRMPMMDDRLVPYALAGGGVTIAEFNDRNPNISFPPVSHRTDAVFVGAVGGGIEYFVARNIALGAEAKYLFGGNPEIKVGGTSTDIDLNSVDIGLHMRVMLDQFADGGDSGTAASAPPAKDSDETRGYLALRGGGWVPTQPNAADGLDISARHPFWLTLGFATGLNLDGNWGAELAGEYHNAVLNADGLGKVSKYSMWTLLGQVRYRYPVMDDRLSPYVVAGGGIGFGEIADKRIPGVISGGRDTAFVGSAGAGLDYFLADNVAFNLEAKHVFLFSPEVTFAGRGVELKVEPLYFTGGLRIFF